MTAGTFSHRYAPNLGRPPWAHGAANGDPAGVNDSACFEVGPNLVAARPGFVSEAPVAQRDFRLKPSSVAWAMGWVALAEAWGPA
jgi:hypothetical protein